MGQLRDTLDETEKQARDLEREKAELRRAFDETQSRLEKLQKSSKVRASMYCQRIATDKRQTMSDELRILKAKGVDSNTHSSRASIESSRSRITSPAPKASGSPADIDYVYLKNVLLQFLEQRDKKYQQQLIPVLGMLLHFDKYVHADCLHLGPC